MDMCQLEQQQTSGFLAHISMVFRCLKGSLKLCADTVIWYFRVLQNDNTIFLFICQSGILDHKETNIPKWIFFVYTLHVNFICQNDLKLAIKNLALVPCRANFKGSKQENAGFCPRKRALQVSQGTVKMGSKNDQYRASPTGPLNQQLYLLLKSNKLVQECTRNLSLCTFVFECHCIPFIS